MRSCLIRRLCLRGRGITWLQARSFCADEGQNIEHEVQVVFVWGSICCQTSSPTLDIESKGQLFFCSARPNSVGLCDSLKFTKSNTDNRRIICLPTQAEVHAASTSALYKLRADKRNVKTVTLDLDVGQRLKNVDRLRDNIRSRGLQGQFDLEKLVGSFAIDD